MPQQPSNAYAIGTLMCQATRDILWTPAKHSVRDRNPNARLALRVGSGQATYHRFDPRAKKHLINYGSKMIVAKQRPETAQGWLSTREIRGKGYFGGEVSVLNLLAHTCCHEFAHLLQHSAGQRHYGSVHNRYFYGFLDELHRNGSATATRRFLAEEAQTLGIDLPTTVFALPAHAIEQRRWQAGDPVSFGNGAHRKIGQIVRVNRKTCTVVVSGRAGALHYRVPLALLKPGPVS